MNVLSLFDGTASGLQSLKQSGIKVDNYFASEIDKYAMSIAKKNHPEIVHIGSVTEVSYVSGVLYWLNGSAEVEIDLIIGGSPCQGFSFAGKQLNFNDPRSKLFFEYVRLREETQAKYFFLENVVMKQAYQDVISEKLGVTPHKINSALVSAQTRKRLYWTNIQGIEQPEDKGIVLLDILEYEGTGVIKNRGELQFRDEKAMCLDASYYKGVNNHGQRTQIVAGRLCGRRKNENGVRADYNKAIPIRQYFEVNGNPMKTNCLTTVEKDNYVMEIEDKALCLTAGYANNPSVHEYKVKRIKQLIPDGLILAGMAEDIKGHDILKRVYAPEGKAPTLTANSGGNQEAKVALPGLTYRKLTPVECERLQGLPDGYTEGVSNTQRYKMLGNGWQVDTIVHIFSYLHIQDIL